MRHVVEYQTRNQTRRCTSISTELEAIDALLTEGATRRCLRAATALLDKMGTDLFDNDSSLKISKQALTQSIDRHKSIVASGTRTRRVAQLFQETESQLLQLLPRPGRRRKANANSKKLQISDPICADGQTKFGNLEVALSLNLEPLVPLEPVLATPDRTPDLLAANFNLKMELGALKQTIQLLEEKLAGDERRISVRREQLGETQGKSREIQQRVLACDLEMELVKKQNACLGLFEQQTAKENELDDLQGALRRVHSTFQQRIDGLIENIAFQRRSCALLEENVDIHEHMLELECGLRHFRQNPPHIDFDISAFCESLDVTLGNLQTEFAELSYTRARLEEEDEADSGESDALRPIGPIQRRSLEQPNTRDDGDDLVLFVRKRVARNSLRSAAYSKHQQSAKEMKAKRSKSLAKMQKRFAGKNASAVLISELESVKLRTEALEEQMRGTLRVLEEASGDLRRAYARRDGLRDGADCLADTLRASEVWEELSNELMEATDFLEECTSEASQMQLSLGRIPIDDETLDTKLVILAEAVSKIMDEVFADPEAERMDRLVREIDHLKAENREIQRSIDSLLQAS
jgi:hypothetical protein